MVEPVHPENRPAASAAKRYLFVLLVGLVLGIVATVMLMRAWQARLDPLPGAVMTVMAKQMSVLRQSREQNRCTPADVVPRLQTLRAVSNDIDAAFGPLGAEDGFQQQASKLRAVLNDALAQPPADCQALEALNQEIGRACEACHQAYAN